MPTTDVNVQFRKVGGHLCPVRVSAERGGIWPDDKGNLPDPKDGELLEEMVENLLGIELPDTYEEPTEKAIPKELRAEIEGSFDALAKAQATFAQKVAAVQKNTGYPVERAKKIVGAMVAKMKKKGKD